MSEIKSIPKNQPREEYNNCKNNSCNGRGAIKRFFLNLMLSVLALIGVCVLLLILLVSYYMTTHIDTTVASEVYSADMYVGPSRLYYYDYTNRAAREGERCALEGGVLDGGRLCIPVTYEQLPDALVDAFVAIEDKRFFQHHGVDWLRTARAGLYYLSGNRYADKFGASTITQQLVKNMTGENDYSVERKIQEICRANALEHTCSKQEILEKYVNIINLSRGCYGVGAAAKTYFGKEVQELTLGECAAIAAITNNPSYYDPVRFPEHTTARRNVILNEMAAQGYISSEDAAEAGAEPLVVLAQERGDIDRIHSWYVDMVVEDVISDLCRTYGYTREEASRLLWGGGLEIDIAMQPQMQASVENYYRELRNFPIHSDGRRAQSAIIVLDVQTGDILAIAGAIGEKTGNRLQSYATGARRPAASAIKPLSVYAPALQKNKITWASVFDDVPVSFGNYNLSPAAGKIIKPVAWPKNANRLYRGLTDIRYAISHSVNTIAVRVLREIGNQSSFDFLHDTLNMKSLIEQKTLENGRTITDCGEAALALGQMNYGVTLRELTAGYSMLASGGVYLEPHSYYRVTAPDGTVLLSKSVQGTQALSEQNAYVMTKLLQDVVLRGTAKGASIARMEVAGKTGTSNADFDKWFIGYTPQLLAGVWYGFEYPASLSDIKENPAVRIWRENMSDMLGILQKTQPLQRKFASVEGVIRATYCMDSGGIPTDACRADLRGDRSAVGYFVQGTQPRTKCSCHALYAYDIESGVLAGEETPEELRRMVGLIRVKRSFPKKIYVADSKYVAG